MEDGLLPKSSDCIFKLALYLYIVCIGGRSDAKVFLERLHCVIKTLFHCSFLHCL